MFKYISTLLVIITIGFLSGSAEASSGKASYYWQPQRVASGGWFNPNAMTAAHKTLPFGTKVRVTNKRNGRSAVVTINDRGPYVAGRVIDLSRAAAQEIGMIAAGVVDVSVDIIGSPVRIIDELDRPARPSKKYTSTKKHKKHKKNKRG